MGLSEKIEEIRRKPEHIRERYAYLAAIMLFPFILVIWIFSMKADNAASEQEDSAIGSMQNVAEQFSQEKNKMQDIINEGQEKIKQQSESQSQPETNDVGKAEEQASAGDIPESSMKDGFSENKEPKAAAPNLFPADSGI